MFFYKLIGVNNGDGIVYGTYDTIYGVELNRNGYYYDISILGNPKLGATGVGYDYCYCC